MGIGAGIFLLLVGGVLAFGVKDTFKAVDLTTIGYVCMAVGVLAVILGLVLQLRSRRSTHTHVVERRDDRMPPPAV